MVVSIHAGLCQEDGDELYELFQQVAKDYESGTAFLGGLGPDQILALCDGYGSAVTEGATSGESLLVEECLRVLRDRKAISARVLLGVAADRSLSAPWRRRALRYAYGRGGFVVVTSHDIEAAIATYIEIVGDKHTPAELRCEACRAASGAVQRGYDLLVTESARGQHLGSLSLRELLVRSAHVRDYNAEVNRLVVLLCRIALDGESPPLLRDCIVPATLRSVVMKCRSFTPGLELLKGMVARLGETNAELSRDQLQLVDTLDHLASEREPEVDLPQAGGGDQSRE
jgi:hypothetical protein